jgi:hypothetical protein
MRSSGSTRADRDADHRNGSPTDCGRDAHYWAPPAQNRLVEVAAALTAGDVDEDAVEHDALLLILVEAEVEKLAQVSPARYTSRLTFVQFTSTKHGIDLEFYQEFYKWVKICCNFPYTNYFALPYVSFKINLGCPTGAPI